MRAVLCGLFGVAFAASGAQAGSCALDGASLTVSSTARWSSEVARPDLIGRSVQVERVASRWRSPKVAEITVIVRSGVETFLVQQVSDFSGAPVDTVLSAVATDKAARSVNWTSRSPAAEAAHFHGVLDGIAVGPLVSLSLSKTNCT